jgi:hypothetical protein
MALIQEKDRTVIQTRFEELGHPVKLINFTQELECMYCSETRTLMEEVAGLSDKVSLEVYNFVNDKDQVNRYSIDKIPATVVEGEKDYGIRFFGFTCRCSSLPPDRIARRLCSWHTDSRSRATASWRTWWR